MLNGPAGNEKRRGMNLAFKISQDLLRNDGTLGRGAERPMRPRPVGTPPCVGTTGVVIDEPGGLQGSPRGTQ